MSYEINVSLDGQHFFATHPRSLDGLEQDAIDMYRLMVLKFPESEGYKVSVSKEATTGTRMTKKFDEIIGNVKPTIGSIVCNKAQDFCINSDLKVPADTLCECGKPISHTGPC
tara:strand:+ start:161 stop:499 length:339 start_codon:yes stop_codon:yes gene_type:complete